MLKNITFIAEEFIIQRARQRTNADSSTLNAEFRRRLAQYTQRPQSASYFRALMDHFNYTQPGKVFSRDDLNER